MTLTLSMAPGVAALRAEAVAYPPHYRTARRLLQSTIQTKNMTLVWGTDHVNALVNVIACYIPFRFAELSSDVTTEVYRPARKIKSAPHCWASEATAKRIPTRCVNISPVCSSTVA